MQHTLSILKRTILSTTVFAMAVLVTPGVVFAATDPHAALCQGAGGTTVGNACTDDPAAPTVLGTIQNITNILLFVIGAIAVIMVIVGAIRYVMSAGDQNALTSAKNTILYALIGVVVAFLAYAVVNFVINNINSTKKTDTKPTLNAKIEDIRRII